MQRVPERNEDYSHLSKVETLIRVMNTSVTCDLCGAVSSDYGSGQKVHARSLLREGWKVEDEVVKCPNCVL